MENLTNCQCSTAENLFDAGIIECADAEDVNSNNSPPACPADCTVCQTCMVLLGCPDVYPKNTNTNANTKHHVLSSPAGKFAMMTMLASAVGVGVALVLQRVNHRNEVKNLGKSQSLPAALIGTNTCNNTCTNNNGGGRSQHRGATVTPTRCEVNQETGKTVWLAPIS